MISTATLPAPCLEQSLLSQWVFVSPRGRWQRQGGGGGLKSVPPLGSLCLQPPGPGPLHRGVTKERAKCLGERGPEKTGALTKMRGGDSHYHWNWEGPPPPITSGGGVALPKESLQSVLAPLQSQETPNKTRVAWAEAHGQGSFTSVYTAGSTPNCLLCDSLHGRLCLDHDRRSGSLHSQSLSPRMTFPVPS